MSPNLPIESIEATDEYTVVFKMSKLDLSAFQLIYNDSHEGSWIFPPEVIEQHGHMQDWKTAVGTGPWMLTDWVKGSALTYTKNPNYWGHDEKFPEHRLPYLDEVKMLIIPEFSTRLAALRAGRIARLRRPTFDQWQAIRKTDPELVWTTVPGNSWDYAMDVRKPPFDDIRVRTAMQLALDLEAMNDTMMGGTGRHDTVRNSWVGYRRVSTPHSRSGPTRSRTTTPTTRKGQKRCSMRLDIPAARMVSDSRPNCR